MSERRYWASWLVMMLGALAFAFGQRELGMQIVLLAIWLKIPA